MILIDEAVVRYADLVGPFGANPVRNRQPRHIATLLDEVDRLLPDDLSVPLDLRDFWTEWNPSSFGLVLGDGMPTVERTLVDWERSHMPNILLLVCSLDRRSIYIEGQSQSHPGTRLYLADTEDQIMHLWGIGIAGLLDLIADAYIETGADPKDPCRSWVDLGILYDLAEQANEHLLVPALDRRVDLLQPDSWPRHWQLANGLGIPV